MRVYSAEPQSWWTTAGGYKFTSKVFNFWKSTVQNFVMEQTFARQFDSNNLTYVIYAVRFWSYYLLYIFDQQSLLFRLGKQISMNSRTLSLFAGYYLVYKRKLALLIFP